MEIMFYRTYIAEHQKLGQNPAWIRTIYQKIAQGKDSTDEFEKFIALSSLYQLVLILKRKDDAHEHEVHELLKEGADRGHGLCLAECLKIGNHEYLNKAENSADPRILLE